LKKKLNIGLVVHGPKIIDSGFALNIIEFLSKFGDVKAILGGTMGRTAVIDAGLEKIIDINFKRLPSDSIAIHKQNNMDLIILINYGKSETTGHSFGFKVFNNSYIKNNWKIPPFIQIERPGENDGTVILWNDTNLNNSNINNSNLNNNILNEIAKHFNLEIIKPKLILKKHFPEKLELYNNYLKFNYPIVLNDNTINILNNNSENEIRREIKGAEANENIFVNGVVIGKSTSSKLTLIAKDGYIVDIIGGKIKKHGIEKLSKIDLNKAIVKTGLLRTSKVKARVLDNNKNKSYLKVSILNHIAEDVYNFKDSDLIVTIGDDTTLISSDILYRFNIPIIGITDGDLDNVVAHPFRNEKSKIIELESGFDDIIGDLIFKEFFKSKTFIQFNINKFKNIEELIDMVENEIIELIKRKEIKYKIF
jgi:hypothetical protein